MSEAVNKILPSIMSSLPEGMQVSVAHDKSVFIAESIKNVYTTIGEAVILVILIIFLFLRSVRATLIPLVTIPVSLIGAFALMHAFGFSINTLTLLALVLAIGLVVDDAIVMLENIYRHVEGGMAPVKAALLGSREISFAIIAMTITLAAVYAPIGFMTGLTGRLFTEFAWTLAGAVIVSGFVALTLSPMMCSKLLKHQSHHNLAYRVIERFLDWVTKSYRMLLKGALAARPLILVIGLAVACSSYFLFITLKSELAPVEDEGRINVNFRGPEGATIDFTDAYAKQLEDIALAVPEADRVFVVAGSPTVSQGRVILRVKPWGERERSQQEIGRSITPEVSGVTGVVAFPSNSPPLGQSSRSKPINFVIQTSQPYSELQKMVDTLLDKARDYPGLVDLESDLKLNSPQLDISVDREKAASMGVEIETLGRTLGDPTRRPAGHAIQERGPAIRRRGQGRRYRSREPRRYAAHLCARIRRRDDPAVEPHHHQGDGGAEGTEPLQPASRRHHHRASRAGLFLERCARLSRGHRRRGAAAHGAYRICGRVSGVSRGKLQHVCHLPARARLHLSGARRSVRELHRSLHHHADRAAIGHRRAARPVVERWHAQHL